MENTTMFGGSLWIWVIFIGFTVISWLISHQLKSRFQKYSKIPSKRYDRKRCSGKNVAG